MRKVPEGPRGNQIWSPPRPGQTWLRPQYLVLISPIFHFIIRNISVGGFLLKDLKNVLLIGFSWLNNYFLPRLEWSQLKPSEDWKYLIKVWSLTLAWTRQSGERVSLYSCLCFLSPNNLWSSLTEMFYLVSLYLIVCHLTWYWVTSCHIMTAPTSHLCHTTLAQICLICCTLWSMVGLWGWWSVSCKNNHLPVYHQSELWTGLGLVLSTEDLARETLLTFPTTVWRQFGLESYQMLAIVL